jgi:asparagine synthase (glutamine-hydrolysing)
MCGISGLVNCGDSESLARMTHIQAHRGPDDSGIWEQCFPDGTYIGLGSRRLAILDLSSSGRMPMCNEDRTVWITYNGEIYNYRALRNELIGQGFHFFSDTDTEVVLRLYERHGYDCVKKLNGMFAFAVCDLRSGGREIFLARDHFGVKPLYYWHRGHKLAFASEIKALLEIPGVEAAMDPVALHQYLTFLWVPDPATMFKNILKLPAGHFATFRDGDLRLTQYWDLTFPEKETAYPRSERELVDEVRGRFENSVKGQMVSDVPVGAFLSAGLDSSSIVAMMTRVTNQTVRTYTITFPQKYRIGESTLDDPAVPSRLAKHLGCENEQIVVEPNVTDLLPRLTWHMDEPTGDPAIIPAYLVCEAARPRSTVLLSGVGGDELFAGYRKHIAHYWTTTYQELPASLRRLGESAVLALPSMRGSKWKGSVRLAKKMARGGSLSPTEQFIRNCTYLDDEQKSGLYAESLRDAAIGTDAAARHREAFERVQHADFLNQMLYVDTKIFMVSLNLTYNDKMSMASSVEVRVPFLDREFAEFAAWNIPPERKLRRGMRSVTKYIFRKAMHDILPAEVLNQPKAGFAAPIDYWLANDLRLMVDDLLSEAAVRSRGLFRPSVVRRYVEEHRTGVEDWSMQIWQFLTLELWMQTFLDTNSRRGATVHTPQVANA